MKNLKLSILNMSINYYHCEESPGKQLQNTLSEKGANGKNSWNHLAFDNVKCMLYNNSNKYSPY